MEEKKRLLIYEKLNLLAEAFSKLLYEEDTVFLEGMKEKNGKFL